MSQVKVFINTFDTLGNYSGFQEVTKDANESTLQKVTQKLDNNEYDVGVFKNTSFNLSLRNDGGKFSEPDVLQSIFINKRIDSIVKVTWGPNDYDVYCGFSVCGQDFLGEDQNVFYGLLNDVATSQDIQDQNIKFSCQGLESIFDRVETNYSALNPADVISDLIYDLLNQAEITGLMNLSAGNISVGIDQVPDSIASLEETTVKEALDQLLSMSNSIVYIDISSQNIYVKPREAGVSLSYTFYGQASDAGSENILKIKNIKSGLNRTFNFWKWQDSTITSKDIDSIDNFGVRKKEISSDLFTNTTKRTNVLDNYKGEFKTPKQELEVTAILDYETMNLFLLDKVAIDYPTLFSAAVGSSLPYYGSAVYGSDKYPLGQWGLTISPDDSFKILGRSVDLKNQTINFNLRKI